MTHLTRSIFTLTAAALVLGTTGAAHAVDIVNDTWIDGTRTDPVAGPLGYSENGVDGDADGNLESAWFRGNGGTMTVAPGGPLVTTTIPASPSANASSWTTYFTPEATPVTLAAAGDEMKVTWVFTPDGVNLTNSVRDFRIAIANSATRLAADGAPGSGDYNGYALFSVMGQTLGGSGPFSLYERATTTGAFLSTTSLWASRLGAGTAGSVGYADDTQYTFTFSATRGAGTDLIDPADDTLSIVMSMAGGNIDGDGLLSLNYTDTTPNTFSFDTFGIRPSSQENSAQEFRTSLFRVELNAIPEPASLALVGLGCLAMLRRRA